MKFTEIHCGGSSTGNVKFQISTNMFKTTIRVFDSKKHNLSCYERIQGCLSTGYPAVIWLGKFSVLVLNSLAIAGNITNPQ